MASFPLREMVFEVFDEIAVDMLDSFRSAMSIEDCEQREFFA